MTDRGRKFDSASLVMAQIAADYGKIKNNGVEITRILEKLKLRIDSFEIESDWR